MGEVSAPSAPLVSLSPARQAAEQRGAALREAMARSAGRAGRRMRWQCVGLAFLGVPLYLWSWHATDPREAELAVTAAFLVSYAGPFLRWLVYHVADSEAFRR